MFKRELCTYNHSHCVYIYIHRYIYTYSLHHPLSTNHPKSTQTALAKLVAASCSRLYRVTDRSSALWQNTLYYIIIPYSSLSGWWFLTHSRNMSHLNLSSLLYPFVWLKKQYITYWTPPTILPWNLYGTAMVQPKTIAVSRSWWTYRLEPRKSDIAGWAIP